MAESQPFALIVLNFAKHFVSLPNGHGRVLTAGVCSWSTAGHYSGRATSCPWHLAAVSQAD